MNAQAQPESSAILPGSREEMRVLRKNSNWVNMMIAILACFAVVVGALLMAPQPEVETERVVDYQAIAQQAQGSADFDLIVPEIPPGWSSNEASLGQVGDSEHTSWYMSFIGAEQQWVSIEQAAASQKWAENQVGDAVPAETATVGGARFQVYRAEDGREHWVTSHDDMYVVLSATALPETVDGFAQQIADQLR